MQEQEFGQKIKNIGWVVIIMVMLLTLYPFIADLVTSHEAYEPLDLLAEPEVYGGRTKEEFVGALLKIAAIDLATPVIRGTSPQELEKAVGWYEASALPGEGNTAIAGHRAMHGAQFNKLHLLQLGDIIVLAYRLKTYKYQVEKMFTVSNTDWSIIEPLDQIALTLTTSYPGDRGKRKVVRAILVEIIGYQESELTNRLVRF